MNDHDHSIERVDTDALHDEFDRLHKLTLTAAQELLAARGREARAAMRAAAATLFEANEQTEHEQTRIDVAMLSDRFDAINERRARAYNIWRIAVLDATRRLSS